MKLSKFGKHQANPHLRSNTWEYALSLGRSKSEKYNVVSSLVDLKVTEPSQLDFSSHELAARLDLAKESSKWNSSWFLFFMLLVELFYFITIGLCFLIQVLSLSP